MKTKKNAGTHLPEQDGVGNLLVYHATVCRHPVGYGALWVDAVSVPEQKPRVEHRDADGVHLQKTK